MPPNKWKIRVFGKPGCDKCALLNSRLDKLLAKKEEWKTIEKEYCDVETEEGIVKLCEAECINPQRLPAMLVMRWNEAIQDYEPIPRPAELQNPALFGNALLYNWLGLQTDYSEQGKGILSPAMLEACIAAAVSG